MTKHATLTTALKTFVAAAAIGSAGLALAQTSTMPSGSATGGAASSSQYRGAEGTGATGPRDPYSSGAAATGTRDPYTSGARAGDKFDPYTQGANQSTQQYLAPTGQDAEIMSGRYGYQNQDTHYHDLSTLGSRVGRRSQFLDGGN